jgi:hypothetical protein
MAASYIRQVNTIQGRVNKSLKSTRRRDHYLPQGYLRGFIDPARRARSRPLWHFDIGTKAWAEKSTRQVGYAEGFYDYATESPELVHPDRTFARLERDFPVVRDRLLVSGFSGWRSELEFLLSFMDMIRARSPLFLSQKEAENRAVRGWTVKSVGPEPNKVTLESMEAKPMSEAWIRNRTIAQMREEIVKGPVWAREFHWCLRFTESPTDPVITADQPFVCAGPRNNPVGGLQDPDTLLYFPLCWQACLIGNVLKFNVDKDQFVPSFLKSIRNLYRGNAKKFLISPQPVNL